MPAEPTPSEVRTALDATVARWIPAFLLVGGFLYAGYVAFQFVLPSPGATPGLVAAWAATAVAFTVAGSAALRWNVRPGLAHPVLGAAAALIVFDSLYLVWTTGEPVLSLVLALVMLGFAVFLLSMPWLVAIVTTCLLGWVVLVSRAPSTEAWQPIGVMLASAAALAVLAQWARVRSYARLEGLRRQELRHLETVKEVERLRGEAALKTRLINTAAHELRTPLTPINLQVYMIEEGALGELNPGQQQAFKILRRSFDRLSRVVAGVTDAARLESDALEVQKAPMDLAQTVRAAVADLQPVARHEGKSVEVDAPGPLPVVGDERRLTQVVTNLLDNAIRFSPEGTRIVVRALPRAGAAVVEVQDEGLGLSADQLARIFRPFAQVHDPLKETRTGAGLGLYISKAILERHGGSLSALSPGPGRGSTFRFTMPLADASRTSRPGGDGGDAIQPMS